MPNTKLCQRGQSEVVGVLLLTAVIVVVVGLVGAFVLSGVDTESAPSAEVEIDVDATTVQLTHAGGDDLVASDVTVVFGRNGSGETTLANFTETKGDGDGRFEGGEQRTTSHSAADVISVTVVHDPSNEVLARELLDVPE